MVTRRMRRLWRRLPVVLLAFLLLVGMNAYIYYRQGQDRARQTQDRTEARQRDCRSLDAAAAGIEKGMSVILTFSTPSTTDEQKARLQQFLDAYNKAVDDAIVTAKQVKGYSPDCSTVNNK